MKPEYNLPKIIEHIRAEPKKRLEKRIKDMALANEAVGFAPKPSEKSMKRLIKDLAAFLNDGGFLGD